MTNEVHKKRVKSQCDKFVRPRVFSKGDIVLLYDQNKDPLGKGKFKSMWLNPYIVNFMRCFYFIVYDFNYEMDIILMLSKMVISYVAKHI